MKNNTKELIGIILFVILDLIITYAITTPLGIKNVILFESLTAMKYTITYEVLILSTLGLIESIFYEKIVQKKSEA